KQKDLEILNKEAEIQAAIEKAKRSAPCSHHHAGRCYC
ncbi:hypothetical protein CEXT_383011, partial [Caerostris extrusa]